MVLQVDAFAGRIRRQEDAYSTLAGVGLKSGFDSFPFLGIHAAENSQEAVAAREAFRRQNALQPVLRGPIFGEDDDSVVGPLAPRPNVLLKPADQLLGLGIEPGLGSLCPCFHFFQEGQFVAGRLVEEQAGRIDCFVGGFLGLLINGVFLLHPVDLCWRMP